MGPERKNALNARSEGTDSVRTVWKMLYDSLSCGRRFSTRQGPVENI